MNQLGFAAGVVPPAARRHARGARIRLRRRCRLADPGFDGGPGRGGGPRRDSRLPARSYRRRAKRPRKIMAFARDGAGAQVVTLGTEMVVHAQKDERFRDVVNARALSLCDTVGFL